MVLSTRNDFIFLRKYILCCDLYRKNGCTLICPRKFVIDHCAQVLVCLNSFYVFIFYLDRYQFRSFGGLKIKNHFFRFRSVTIRKTVFTPLFKMAYFISVIKFILRYETYETMRLSIQLILWNAVWRKFALLQAFHWAPRKHI